MKIAIPVFQNKISPRFDNAQNFIFLDIEDDSIVDREELVTRGWIPSQTIKELIRRGVEGMICGGIDRASKQCLRHKGVLIYSWVTGEVADAVASFINHGLESGAILGREGKQKGRWRFGTETDT